MPEPGLHCIEIERPAGEVFDFAAGLHNAPLWLPGVLEVSALGAAGGSAPAGLAAIASPADAGFGPLGPIAGPAADAFAAARARRPRLGGRYQARLHLPGGARRLRFQVSALMPGELMVLRAEAPLPLRLLLMVKPSSARRTRICWRCELQGGWPERALERALLAVLRGVAESRYAHRALRRLKLLLEVAPAMRAAQLRRIGPPSQALEIAEAPLPAPGPREVLVRVAASSVNPADLTRMADGRRWAAPGARLPLIPGRDLSGVVAAAGARVRRFRVGDAVWGAGPGAWAEFAAVPERALAPKPPSLSDAEAAALLSGFGAFGGPDAAQSPLRGIVRRRPLMALRGKLAAWLRGGRAQFRPGGAALAKIGRQVEAERIRPAVELVLPLAQIDEAVAQVESRRAPVVLWLERGAPP